MNVERLIVDFLSRYLDDALFSLSDQFALELLGHLGVKELVESSLYGESSLPVPLLHLVAELVPVVKLLDLIKVGLVSSIPTKQMKTRAWGENVSFSLSLLTLKL